MKRKDGVQGMSVPFVCALEKDRVIRGDYFPAKAETLANVIICHGYKGFKDWGFFPHAAERISEAAHVITFNFSHNGVGERMDEFSELDKFATNTYTKELEDLDTLVRLVQEGALPVDPAVYDAPRSAKLPLILLGHSRGGGVSLVEAFDHPERIAGVISWNGVTNLDLFSENEKEEMRTRGRTYVMNARTKQQMPLDAVILEDLVANRERYDIIGRAPSCPVPIALIQGTEDHDKLRKGSERLLGVQPETLYIPIQGGDHTFKARHPFQGETEPLRAAIEASLNVIRQFAGDMSK